MHVGLLSFAATHVFPLWFLVVSLFLPRLSLLVWWWDHQHGNVFVVPILLPLIVAVLVPRALILYLIYTDQGISGWFLLHAIALVIAWYGVGGRYAQRRWSDDV